MASPASLPPLLTPMPECTNKCRSRNWQILIMAKCAVAFLAISFICQFAYLICQFLHCKNRNLNVQKKAVPKFADLVRVHKNRWTLMLTERSAHAAWFLYARQSAIRRKLASYQ